MAFERIGIDLSQRRLAGRQELAEGLRELEAAGPDFVEIAPRTGSRDPRWAANEERTDEVEEMLAAASHAYTVHASHALDLMDWIRTACSATCWSRAYGSRPGSGHR